MINILFVDDDDSVLDSLKRLFFDLDEDWNFTFALSGSETLKILAEDVYDVVISDLRMPEMNGAQLLKEIKRLYPSTIRIILSGYSDTGYIIKTVEVADQFLSKPISPEELISTIRKALSSNDYIDNKEFKDTVDQYELMPTIPLIYMEICEAVNLKNVEIKDVARIVKKDIIISTKILKLVNSSFFGLRRQIDYVEDAINYLGFDVVKALALTTELFRSGERDKKSAKAVGKINRMSIMNAKLASHIMKHGGADDNMIKMAYLTGLLCDLGKIVFIDNIPNYYEKLAKCMNEKNLLYHDAEKKLFGITHGELSAYLLGKWGFNEIIINNIFKHHDYSELKKEKLTIAGSVIVANLLVSHKLNEFKYANSIRKSLLNVLEDNEINNQHIDFWMSLIDEKGKYNEL